jgi:hypothetical protein
MKSLRLSLAGLAALLLTSCMVGPNYSRPSAPCHCVGRGGAQRVA